MISCGSSVGTSSRPAAFLFLQMLWQTLFLMIKFLVILTEIWFIWYTSTVREFLFCWTKQQQDVQTFLFHTKFQHNNSGEFYFIARYYSWPDVITLQKLSGDTESAPSVNYVNSDSLRYECWCRSIFHRLQEKGVWLRVAPENGRTSKGHWNRRGRPACHSRALLTLNGPGYYLSYCFNCNVKGSLAEEVVIRRGVCRKCVLSPLFFNLYLEAIFAWTLEGVNSNKKGNSNTINTIHDDDDTAVITSNLPDFQQLIVALVEHSERYGLSWFFQMHLYRRT